jgi:MFS family permease
LFLALLSFVLYLDRICMGQAAVPIQRELGFSDETMGWVHAAFIIAYGLFEVPTGRWGDRHGSRGVLVRIVLWWSAFTALTGAATSLAMLLVVRFLFGAGEAGALPNAARVVARWFPPDGRGPAQGVVTTCTLLGGVVAPMAAQGLIGQVGWRWTFALFGAVGVLWAGAFYLWYRDDPAEHPGVNAAERVLIKGLALPEDFNAKYSGELPGSVEEGNRGEGTEISAAPVCAPSDEAEQGDGAPAAPFVKRTTISTPEGHPPVPWRLALASANLWLLGGVISCSAFASYLYYSWYPKYLVAARGLSDAGASQLTSLVLAGGAIGCLLGGYLGDWLVRRTGERRWTRSLLGSSGLALAAGALLTSLHYDAPLAAAGCTAVASLTASVSLTTWWAVVTAVSGRHLGALFGLLNSLGVPGAFASQVFFGWMSDRMHALGFAGRGQYDPAFYVYGGVLLLGAVGWLFIDTRKSLVERAPDA